MMRTVTIIFLIIFIISGSLLGSFLDDGYWQRFLYATASVSFALLYLVNPLYYYKSVGSVQTTLVIAVLYVFPLLVVLGAYVFGVLGEALNALSPLLLSVSVASVVIANARLFVALSDCRSAYGGATWIEHLAGLVFPYFSMFLLRKAISE